LRQIAALYSIEKGFQMTPEQQAAFVNSQAAAALIAAMGMMAENQQRASRGDSPAYVGHHFEALIDQFGIGHNAALQSLGLG
jgi:hypothetical protein